MTQLMKAWYQIRVRAVLRCASGDKDIPLLSRLVRWKSDSILVEVDSKHCLLFMERLGLGQESYVLSAFAIQEDVGEDEGEPTKEESTGT